MKEEILHTSPTILISWILSIAALGFLFIIFTVERERIRVGLSGTDITWQFLELAGVVWLVLFPLSVISALLGNTVDKEVWNALEIVFGVGVAGKGYYKYVDKDKKTQSSSYERTTHTTKEPKVDKPSGDPTSLE